MTLIRVFLERPRMLILSLIFFLLVGYSGFNNLPRQETPELAERWGLLIQVYPGTSPEQIETQVTEVLEIKLREIPEIRNLISNITQGAAFTLDLVLEEERLSHKKHDNQPFLSLCEVSKFIALITVTLKI